MDGKDFDDIAQKLGSNLSRRRALGGIAAGLLGATGLAAVAEAKNAGKTKSAGKGKGNKHKVGKKQTCTGCTQPFLGVNICLGGVDEFACGANGQQCAPCSNDGAGDFFQVCSPNQNGRGGTCTTPAGCSSPQCQTGSTCVTRGSNSACGSRTVDTIVNGQLHQTVVCNAVCTQGNICSGPNNDALCVSQQCGPNTANPCANGCCQGNSCVVAGTNAQQCGTGGGACTNCNQTLGPNAICSSTGTCVVGLCGPGSANPCATGCCNGNACIATPTNAQCGTGGGACQTCPANTTCTNGACVAPPCGASNCAGCCNAAGQCQVGTAPNACGFGGVGCAICASNQKCKNGVCKKKHKKH